MDTTQNTPSAGPQIRSRITVVCAECKRLKLKCDRRTPCGSCSKRDTVARCIYSPAAAEKVDLHSLNNRLLQVEATVAQLTAGTSQNNPYSNTPSNHRDDNAFVMCNSASSLVISIQDVLSIWLAELDINDSWPASASSPPTSHVKLEPAPVSVPFDHHIPDLLIGPSALSPTLTLPPLSIYHLPSPSPRTSSSSPTQQPQITPQLIALLPPLSTLDVLSPLMALHPCFNWRHFTDRVRHLLKPNEEGPREWEMTRERPRSSEKNMKTDTTHVIFFGPPRPATRTPVLPLSPSKDKSTHKEGDRDRDKGLPRPSSTCEPTISFFAAVAAAFALATLVSSYGSGGVAPAAGPSHLEMPIIIDFVDGASGANARGVKKKKVKTKQSVPPKLSTSSTSPLTSKVSVCRPSMPFPASCSGPESCPDSGLSSAAFLFALSMQALSVHEMKAHFDLDYLVACVLQMLFLLHGGSDEATGCGKSGVVENEHGGEKSGLSGGKGNRKGKNRETSGGAIFPLVGKMVNIARQMGLGTDPDEFPGWYSLFEAETRRRIWWDVYYYDLFVSDCMGHPPLIQDGSFSTKMPADADEDVFSPASLSIPVPVSIMRRGADADGAVDGWCPTGFKYFELKCRLAQLVKKMKRRTYKDPSSDPRELAYTLEQAAGFESEVRQWLAELPQPFWLDMSATEGTGDQISPLDMTSPSSPSLLILMFHRCELVIAANRLILKLYLPFLRPGANNSYPPYQASHGTVNAAHEIIRACKILYTVRKQHQYQQQNYNADAPKPMLMLIPAMFGFYSFGRTLFDAAAVCAHAAIKQPMTVWAVTALADVGVALEVMRDPIVAGAVYRGGAGMEGDVYEAVKVIEIMQMKAETARSGGFAAVGMKRKHGDLELSYAVPSLSGRGSPAQPKQQPDIVSMDVSFSNPWPKFETAQKGTPASNGRDDGDEKAQSGDHAKKVQHPILGLRARQGKENEGLSLVHDDCHRSPSTTTTATTSSNESKMYAPAPPPPSSASKAQLRTSVSEDPGYHRPHSQSQHSGGLQQDPNQEGYRRSSLAQDIPMRPHESANANDTVEYFTACRDHLQMDMNVPRRRYSQGFPPDHPHPGTFEQPPRHNTFDPDSRGSFDRSCVDSYAPAASPYANHPEMASSRPMSSAGSPFTGAGATPSSLSTPTFGHNPSPPTFGQQQLHTSPASYVPPRLANPSTHNFYIPNGYDSQYNHGGLELGMDDSSNANVDPPLYEKTHQMMYDVKPPDAHHNALPQGFSAEQGRIPVHNHGIPMGPPQTWSQESPAGQGEYWGGDVKYYQ